MENKINIAELLRDCPTGMELDCLMYDNVYFKCIREHAVYPIVCYTIDSKGETEEITFNWYGKYALLDTAKCVIFPKGKTTWEGFHRPFKDGDVVATNSGAWIGIVTGVEKKGEGMPTYCVIKGDGTFEAYLGIKKEWYFSRLATEEEKARLFQVIKDNGYKWNEKTNTLEKLIEPIFKKGDKIRVKNGVSEPRMIDYVCDRFYTLVPIGSIDFTDQHNWELVPNKFNINTLRPFESRVLVRDYSYEPWRVSFWGCLLDNELGFKYDTIRGPYKQCIPYEGNEHLLGRMEDCADFYKNW